MSTWSRRIIAAGVLAVSALGSSAVGAHAATPLPTATAGRVLGGHAQALGIPGVISASESTAQPGSAPHWTLLSVGGTEILGTSGGTWTGGAAPAGGALPTVNGITCAPLPQLAPDGPPIMPCVELTDAFVSQNPDGSQFVEGEAGRVSLLVGDQGGGVILLPSSASSSPECGGTAEAGASLADIAVATNGQTTETPIAPAEESQPC